MMFAQLSYRESLRDIIACLRSQQRKLYHLGIRGKISRSTLADANESRDWRIYSDFAQTLITEARRLYCDEDLGLDLANTVYALDSTTIDLCMTLFPWAYFSPTQHALKLHTLLDLRGQIPAFIRITPARVHDVNMLDQLTPEPGAFYIMDRGYLNFERLYRWTLHGAFFVTRARKNFRFRRLVSHPVDKSRGVQCDQTISLQWFYSAKGYPAHLRRIRFWDGQREKRLVFLTNNFNKSSLFLDRIFFPMRAIFLNNWNDSTFNRDTSGHLLATWFSKTVQRTTFSLWSEFPTLPFCSPLFNEKTSAAVKKKCPHTVGRLV
jgi:hypothetical protein